MKVTQKFLQIFLLKNDNDLVQIDLFSKFKCK